MSAEFRSMDQKPKPLDLDKCSLGYCH